MLDPYKPRPFEQRDLEIRRQVQAKGTLKVELLGGVVGLVAMRRSVADAEETFGWVALIEKSAI
jgi:hypothetical protein